jgi:hypothetical protein
MLVYISKMTHHCPKIKSIFFISDAYSHFFVYNIQFI